MRRFVEGIDREQATLFPECLEDWIDQDNPVRAIDAFVDKLDLRGVGFDGVAPETTGRPSRLIRSLRKLHRKSYSANQITKCVFTQPGSSTEVGRDVRHVCLGLVSGPIADIA